MKLNNVRFREVKCARWFLLNKQNVSQHGLHNRALRRERRESRCIDGQFLKFESSSLVEVAPMHRRVDINLFTCDEGEILGNSMCIIYHSKNDEAFMYPWVGASLYGNPKYIALFIMGILRKPFLNEWTSAKTPLVRISLLFFRIRGVLNVIRF